MTMRIAVTTTGALADYLASVERVGATPMVVAAETHGDVRQWLREVEGIVLTGGADVDPSFYGERPHASYRGASPGKDAFEIEVVHRALEADVPVLAICRGAQVVNVACGGTLVQDIPSDLPRTVPHHVPEPKDGVAHEVTVAPGSRLHQIMGGRGDAPLVLGVNTRHHQAVKHLAPGLTVTATAPDGVIEGIERPASRFCVAVQWHPENFLARGEFLPLFEALIRAASGS